MKKIFLLILIVISVAAIQSCKKEIIPEGPGNNPTGNTPKGVYVSGVFITSITSDTIISGTTIHRIGGEGIAISGSDVYVCFDWAYWKNGNLVPLEPRPVQPVHSDIVISVSDVYVVVQEQLTFVANVAKVARYWKNGQAVSLTDGTKLADARAIAVSGSDVYVAGGEYNSNGKYVAKYWKNGNPIPLTDGSIFIYLNGITVSGSDVYVAGSEWNGTKYIAKYWKNGNPIPLTDGSKWSEARSIAVSGSDVYVSGFEETTTSGNTIRIGKYWKNGTAVPLSFIDGSQASAQPFDITVSGNDVYVAGSIGYFANGVSKAVYWKNGTPFNLGNGYAYGIAVVP